MRTLKICVALVGLVLIAPLEVAASHISGIRITQTGNTGLTIDVDVTGFYSTGSTETTMYLGTYYNQVPAVDWGDGSTVARYGYGSSTGIPLVSTSTVVNGVPARAYRGSFSHTYGSAGSYTIAANTSCCPLTTPTYTLVSGTILTTTVSTSGPFGPTTFTTSFVQNTLAVNAAPPAFSKAFAPDSTGVSLPSTLTFTIDNTASTLDAGSLDFTDNLPAGLVVASPANVANTCTGGTVTATTGSGTISYSGGLVAAGATCTLSVDVVATAGGVYVNTTGDLTSDFGNSGPASDTLTANVAPVFGLTFSPANIPPGQTTSLIFAIDNTGSSSAAMGLGFSTTLPAGLTVAATPNVTSTCTGGTVTAAAGTSLISYSSGTVAAGALCTISVDVTLSAAGAITVDAGSLTSSLGSTPDGATTATLNAGPAIPTLSQFGLLLMAILLGLFAFLALRRNQLLSQD